MIPRGIVIEEDWWTSLATLQAITSSSPVGTQNTSGQSTGDVLHGRQSAGSLTIDRLIFAFKIVMFAIGAFRRSPNPIISGFQLITDYANENAAPQAVVNAEIHGAGVNTPEYVSGQFTF